MASASRSVSEPRLVTTPRVLAILAAIGALVLLVRGLGADAATARPPTAGMAIAAGEPPRAPASSDMRAPPPTSGDPALPGPAGASPAAASARPSAPPSREETIARLDGARAMLREAAKPCWAAYVKAAASRPAIPRGTPDPSVGMLRFHYNLVVHGGEAEVENVDVHESTITDGQLDSCVRDAVARARWPANGPDGVLDIEDQLRLGDLTVPEPPRGAEIR